MTRPSSSAKTWPFRSLLFTPGHKLDWIKKATRFQPDGIIIDLEDSVPPAEKQAARNTARAGVDYLRATDTGIFVRINPLANGGTEDVLAVMAPGLTAICLPKLNDADQVRELSELLAYAEGKSGIERGSVDIVAIPETANALVNVRDIARSSKRVKSFMTGLIDRASDEVVFAGDTALAAGFIPTRGGLEQIYITSMVCLDSRAGGAAFPVGTILGTDLADPEAARRLAMKIKAIGFTGCVLIHPSHVAIANEIFSESGIRVAD